jgi:hypothetical protein
MIYFTGVSASESCHAIARPGGSGFVARAARRMLLVVAVALPAVGCGAVSAVPDTPFVSGSALGTNGDVDQAAAAIAAWSFADPVRTGGRPINAARAVIALEYWSGTVSSNPRYISTSPVEQQRLLQARREVRQVLGLAQGAKSQEVVDALVAAENALLAGDAAAAERALPAALFTLGPRATLQRLTNLPPLPIANVATQRTQFTNPDGPGCFDCM